MTANKLKDWFINFLPPVDSTLDWNTILTDAISDFGKIFDTDFVADTISHIMAKSQNGQGVQTVRDFNTFLKEQQSYFKTEVTRVQNTVQSLVYYSECDTSQSVESLKSKISSIQENIGTLNDKLLKIQQNERINAELAPIKTIFDGGYDVNKTIEENLNANSAYLDAIKTKSELDAKLAEYNIKLEFLVTRRMEIESDIRDKNHVVSSGGTCPFTCTACDTITALINAFKVEIANLENAHTEVVNSIKDITGQKSETVERIKEAEKNAEQIRQSFVTYSGLSKQIHSDVLNLNRESIVAEINTLKSQIELCNDTIIKIEANRKYEELTTALTQDKYKLEQNIEILKVWIKLTDVNGLQSQLMEAPFKKLADKMSEYLRQFFSDSNKFSSAKFFLSEKANSFSFGVVNADDEYIEFDLLSSGEKCLYTLALLLSIVEDSDSELKLIMIDDLLDHLDAARISDCFATLYNISNIQVLFAGVQNCNHSEADSFVVELASD